MKLLNYLKSKLNGKSNLIPLVPICFMFTTCSKQPRLSPSKISASVVFEDIWQTLDKNYTLFTLKNINWDSVYLTHKPNFENELNNIELFKRLSAVLALLKDGHVSLKYNDQIYSYEGFFSSYPANFNFSNIKTNYLQNSFGQAGPILYKIVDSVGYIYYSSFKDLLKDTDMEMLFSALNATKGLIIDVRDNFGGDVTNVNKLFSRFIDNNRLVKYELVKKGSGHDDFQEMEAYFLSPSGKIYTKPIMLLTNRKCFSACNDFVMYMSSLPNVTIVGDKTGGGGAIPSNYILLNGWKIQYSASITLSPDKIPTEFGIEPDIPVTISSLQDATGIDPILEKAFALLK